MQCWKQLTLVRESRLVGKELKVKLKSQLNLSALQYAVDVSGHRLNSIPRIGDVKISLNRWIPHSQDSLELKSLLLIGRLFQWQCWDWILLSTAKHLFGARTVRDRCPDRECAVQTTGVVLVWIAIIFVQRNKTALAAKPITHQFCVEELSTTALKTFQLSTFVSIAKCVILVYYVPLSVYTLECSKTWWRTDKIWTVK